MAEAHSEHHHDAQTEMDHGHHHDGQASDTPAVTQTPHEHEAMAHAAHDESSVPAKAMNAHGAHAAPSTGHAGAMDHGAMGHGPSVAATEHNGHGAAHADHS